MRLTTHGKVKQNETHELPAPMTPRTESEMSWTKSNILPQPIPTRPQLTSQQSSSLPSTPYQHPRELPFRPGSPNERDILNSSPRSTYSESNHPLPALRRAGNGCKFETGLAFAKRRFPYALGTEKLEPQKPSKERLDEDVENRLTCDMRDLYNRLLPTEDSEKGRTQLVVKLEDLFNRRWPGHTIKVNVFGSSGNKLGTPESDVDICITTDFKDLEHVCLLAEVLADSGMEQVVCVSSAKVPIVKIWDPVLKLACDMNVNNPVALENTRMIRTYVDIDPRVRPLALIIKYWTRKRLLNDAALGATLSSYTWICMIINFLQTRHPPILPALQQFPDLSEQTMEGLNVSYMKDIDRVKDFGHNNEATLGELLYDFFKYYGYELDYDDAIVSVRDGKVTHKQTQPSWQINRLCVQEPFNFSRNLANTADDTSFRGIHFELRRACRQLSDHSLDSCCDQYEHPPEEHRSLPQRNSIQYPRPIPALPVAQANKGYGGRGSNGTMRSGRYANFPNRAPQNIARRASSASNRGQNYQRQPLVGPILAQHEASLQHQQQQQMLHDHLLHQFQMLQAQEQELRMQLRPQTTQQTVTTPSMLYPQIPFPAQFPVSESVSEGSTRPRAGTVNQPPLTAPLHQNGFSYPSSFLTAYPQASQGTSTNPPSPLMNTAVPDLRRQPRRSSLTNGSSGGSLRAHSQPPRTVTSPLSLHEALPQHWAFNDAINPQITGRQRPIPSPASLAREPESQGYPFPRSPLPIPDYRPRNLPAEYVGYYMGPSAPTSALPRMAIPPFGLQTSSVHQGGVHPSLSVPKGYVTQSSPTSPTSTSQAIFSREDSRSASSGYPNSPVSRPQTALRINGGPLIVDGSKGHPGKDRSDVDKSEEEKEPMSNSTSTSGEVAMNTPSSSDESTHGRSRPSVESENISKASPATSKDENRIPPRKLMGLGVSQALQESSLSEELRNELPLHSSLDQKNALSSAERLVLAEPPSNGGIATRDHRGRARKSFMPRESADDNQPSKPSTKELTPTPSFNGRAKIINGLSQGPSMEKFDGRENRVEGTLPQPSKKEKAVLASPLIVNGDRSDYSSQQSPRGVTAPNNGWQTQVRKKREMGMRSGPNSTHTNAFGGHNLPADASLRKGG